MKQRIEIYLMVGILSAILGAGLGFLYATAEPLEETGVSPETVQCIALSQEQKTLSPKTETDLILAEDILPEWEWKDEVFQQGEFEMVCGMVMGEGNGRDMYIAICQCIKNAMALKGWSATETIKNLYGTPRAEWSSLVEECVKGVFYGNLSVTDEPILYYYAEDLCESPWHESQDYCFTILNTRFFKEAV